MTNQQILEKAIQKAIDNGWDFFGKINHEKQDDIWFGSPISNRWDIRYADGRLKDNNIKKTKDNFEIIFNHDFAKALWGEGYVDAEGDKYEDIGMGEYSTRYIAWVFHLQQMVISPDPIKYLADNID